MAGKPGSGNRFGRPRPSMFRDATDAKIYTIFSNARARASAFKWEFDLTFEFVRDMFDDQLGCCCITGKKFNWDKLETSRTNPDAPSIDRIDSYKGYTKDNIRLVTWHVNIAINKFGLERFVDMCADTINFLQIGG